MSETDIRLASLQRYDHPYRVANKALRDSLVPISNAVTDLLAYRSEYGPGELVGELGSVTIAGRVVLKRNAGKIVFATVRSLEREGAVLQVFLAPQNMDAEGITFFKENVHLGDILYATGRLGYSNTHELTLHASDWEMGAKALNPLPKAIKNPETGDLEHDLNKETIHESPVLHMLTSVEHRQNVLTRAVMVRQIRQYFDSLSYLEVETPILSSRAGGAAAAKFTTDSNYRHQNLYLRIATELYLKRLVIGGMGNVFEIGKNFRNEGIDRTHSPEFTALEAYTLHSDYRDQMRITKEAITAAWMGFGNNPMDEVVTVGFFDVLNDAMSAYGTAVGPDTDAETVRRILDGLGIESSAQSAHALMEDLFDEVVVPGLPRAVFVVDYPSETSPLARPNGDGTAQKWDLYLNGMEVATAYTENADPIIQQETLPEDDDFVNDLRYGMPPLGGLGIGLDRLAMVLLDVPHINAVSPFPHSSV